MRNRLSIGLLGAALAAVLCVLPAGGARGDTSPASAADLGPDELGTKTLLLEVMRGWPPPDKPVETVDLEPLAGAIAHTVFTENPVPTRRTYRRLYSASLLAALAYFEGARFAKYVADGRCNDPAWWKTDEGRKLLHYGTCDHRHAYSLWQIHLDALPELNPDMLMDQGVAASKALAIARQSLSWNGTLCRYSGEPYEAGCPKAKERMDFADRAYAAAVAKLPSVLPRE